MEQDIILKVENVSKQYRLGTLGTGTVSHDLNRWWHRVRGKEDPYLKVGETNDRSTKGNSEYVWALKDISFEVKSGEVLGIIGKNGAGKSTLLKILSKVTGPSTGSIKSRGRIASLLEVGTGFHPEMTGRENIYLNGAILGMTKKEINAKIDEIIAFSGCERYIDTPTKRYSSGMTVRLAFAVAAFLEPDILVVDEVLAVGDAEFQKKAIGKMQDISNTDGRTVLFVSHDMSAIQSLCSRLVVLENGKIGFDGETPHGISYYLSTGSTQRNLIIGNNIIKSVNVVNGASFISESNLEIEIDLIINKPIEAPVFLVIINNYKRKKIAEFHTQGVGFNDLVVKDTVLKLSIKKLNLHLGSYTIDIVFYDGKRYEFESVTEFNCIKVNHQINKFHKKENDFYFSYNYTFKS
ncbi:ABC transporter ATP-binding protein [Wenyingzhuangia sp. IMCC45467]